MALWWGLLRNGSLSEVWRRESLWEMAGRKRNRAQATEKQEGKSWKWRETLWVGLLGSAGPVVLGLGSGIRHTWV